MPTRPETTTIQILRAQLLAQAFVFEDPSSYRAGVEDTLDALSRTITDDREPDLVPAGGWFG